MQRVLYFDLSRGTKLRNSKSWINGAQRDPDRHDGWFQGSLTKDENLDRAQKIRPPDKSVHWKAIFSILILIQKNICCRYSKEPSQWDGPFELPQHMLNIGEKNICCGYSKEPSHWDGPSEHPPPKKNMPNIGEKNIPIYVKAKQTRNKSKIKVKQSKAKQVKSKLG